MTEKNLSVSGLRYMIVAALIVDPLFIVPASLTIVAPTMRIGAAFTALSEWGTGMKSLKKPLFRNADLDQRQDCAPESTTTPICFG